MKKSSIYAMVYAMTLCISIHAQEDNKTLMDTLYKNISGYELAPNEADDMTKQPENHAAPTYGEILPKSLEEVHKNLNLNKDDVFIDLGSGVGKVVVQTCLDTPVKKSIGIELAKTRYSKAESVKDELNKQGKLNGRTLEFQNKNIKDVNLSEATVVFMCSTCFSDELMKLIVDKLSQNPNKNLRVVTLKQLPENKYFKLEKTLTLPMTWSNGTQVHIYSRQ